MIDKDRELCQKLLTTSQTVPRDTLFDEECFEAFHSRLRGRSKARIYTDLHPLVMPSIEKFYICGRKEFEGLIEGHNDPWLKSIPFHGPLPQPDHTIGFSWSNFSEQRRRKLYIGSTEKSYYAARDDIYFPFLTGEVKSGRQGLEFADRPNSHSMTIVLRGIVDLFCRLDRSADVHRRVLGFSISHDDNRAHIYAHYPEINGDNTTYWRETLRDISFENDRGKERWTCYQFTLNVCELFALPLLKRLQALIDELPDPAPPPQWAIACGNINVQGSRDEASVLQSQDKSFKRPCRRRGLDAELRNMIQVLQRQLEQQRQEAERQLRERIQAAEQQRQEAERQLGEQIQHAEQ